jgi:predicted Fe-Mo cluster-binding NifX family protein
MLAIPVSEISHEKVAPVFDGCTTVLLFRDADGEIKQSSEIFLLYASPSDYLRVLHEEGVTTLVCAALSQEAMSYGESLGIRIIQGVPREVQKALKIYRSWWAGQQ